MTDPFIEAIHQGRLADVAARMQADLDASVAERTRADFAVGVCAEIGRSCEAERARIVDRLRGAGFDVESTTDVGPRQNHTVELVVDDFEAARRAASELEHDGFEPWQQWTRGAERSARRFAEELVVGSTADVTTVVRFRWGNSRRRSRLRRVVTPTAGDWSMIDVPASMWPVYSLVRPVRLLMERVGIVERHEDSLGPFLSTPESLIRPLLDFAQTGRDDRLLDIGCGDGRIVVAAAEHTGCTAVGVERSLELVERARERAAQAGVADRVDIVHGDGRAADLAHATVVFMFLSMRVVADLVPVTLEQLRPGARLIIHEQSRLPASMSPSPDETTAIIADGAVTVAHRWTKR